MSVLFLQVIHWLISRKSNYFTATHIELGLSSVSGLNKPVLMTSTSERFLINLTRTIIIVRMLTNKDDVRLFLRNEYHDYTYVIYHHCVSTIIYKIKPYTICKASNE